MGQERKRKPIEEKESARWLEGYQLACEVQQSCPDTRVVNVADREGDIHEWFLDAMRRVPEARAECMIRAKGNRRLASGTAPRYVWEGMQKARAAGRSTAELPRQPDRPPRPVTRRVVMRRVTFQGARRPGVGCHPSRSWPSMPRRPDGVAFAHESACGGFPECLYGGAVVSMSGGDSTLFSSAQARMSDRALTRADGAAMAQRHGALSHGGLAHPQYNHGWARLS